MKLQKGLLYKEWIQCKWFLFFVLGYEFVVHGLGTYMNFRGAYGNNGPIIESVTTGYLLGDFWMGFFTPILVAIVMILTFLLMYSDKTPLQGYFAEMLPFTRKEKITHKIIIGVKFILYWMFSIVCIITFLFTIFYQHVNWSMYGQFLLITLTKFCAILFVFSITIMMYTFTSNVFVGFILSSISLVVPYNIVDLLNNIGIQVSNSMLLIKLNEGMNRSIIYLVIAFICFNIAIQNAKYLIQESLNKVRVVKKFYPVFQLIISIYIATIGLYFTQEDIRYVSSKIGKISEDFILLFAVSVYFIIVMGAISYINKRFQLRE